MTTYKIQKDFFDAIRSNEIIANEHISIYQKLIYIRFDDAIHSSLPNYCATLSDDILEYYIREFISYGANTFYIWKIPFEFKYFLFNFNKQLTHEQKEILEFETIQLKMYLEESYVGTRLFNWNKRYRLSHNGKIFLSKYNMLKKSFNQDDIQYILIYKNIKDYDIYYIEITKVMYYLLKNLRNNHTILDALRLACGKTILRYNEVKKVIYSTLVDFHKNKIIR
jgi:hypothetical protein